MKNSEEFESSFSWTGCSHSKDVTGELEDGEGAAGEVEAGEVEVGEVKAGEVEAGKV